MNPRGSPDGRKLAGDRLAEDVHGRKGMDKLRREKGPSRQLISSNRETTVKGLNKDEFQIIWFLHVRKKYCPLIWGWDELVNELSILGVQNASINASEFIDSLFRKTNGWLKYVPSHSICLKGEHAQEIQRFLEEFLQASEDREE